jgi:hypothetical protein
MYDTYNCYFFRARRLYQEQVQEMARINKMDVILDLTIRAQIYTENLGGRKSDCHALSVSDRGFDCSERHTHQEMSPRYIETYSSSLPLYLSLDHTRRTSK